MTLETHCDILEIIYKSTFVSTLEIVYLWQIRFVFCPPVLTSFVDHFFLTDILKALRAAFSHEAV